MVRIQVRRGTAASWTVSNPVLGSGEQGFETDTRKTKFGDGTSAWNVLPYQASGGGATTVDELTDATAIGKSVVKAASAAAARTAMGAGTSSLALGTTSSTAKAGDYQPTAVQVTDLAEYIQDTVAGLLKAGTNVTTAYDDAANTFTINATNSGSGTTDPEVVRDTIGGALVAGSGISITLDDAGDTITIAVAGIPQAAITGLTASLTTLQTNIDAKYTKPGAGIPKTDLATAVQTSLGLADTAVRTVNGTAPDGSGNIVVSGSGGPSSAALGNTTATQTVDVTGAAGKIFRATLAVATTAFTFTNITAGARWLMEIRQDPTGTRAATWTGITWIPTPPVIATASSAVNLFEFFSPDGTTVYGSLLNPTTGGVTLPYPAPASRLEPLPRVLTSAEMTMTAGQLWLTHFIPDRDFVVSNIITHQSGTVSAGASLAKVGIYRYNGGNSYTCIARSANAATRWNTAGENTAPIADNGAATPATITSIALQAGIEYAYATLIVGASTPPQMRAVAVTDKGTLNPRMGATLYSQTDLTASVTASIPTWALFFGAFT